MPLWDQSPNKQDGYAENVLFQSKQFQMKPFTLL